MQNQIIRSGATSAPRNYNAAQATAAPASALLPSQSIEELKEIAQQITLVCETFGLSKAEERHMRQAFMFCTIQNGLVPDAFKGDYRSIYIMSIKAERMGISLAEALQGGYFVHGRHAWYAEFMIARVLELGIFSKFEYEEGGENFDDLWCRAVATRPDGTVVRGPVIDMIMARKEGWTEKKGSKWGTMPAYMLQKRAATFLIRNTAAHVFGGSSETVDEAEERETATAQNPQVIDTKVSAVETMQAIAHADEKKTTGEAHADLLSRIETRLAQLMNAGVEETKILTELTLVSFDDISMLSYQQLTAVMEVLSGIEPPKPEPEPQPTTPPPEQDQAETQRLEMLEKLKDLIRTKKITSGVILEKTGMPASMIERAGLSELVKIYAQLK
jgi:hypothetical protein